MSQTNGAIFSAACAYSLYILSAIERFGVEERVRDHVLFAHAFSMCFLSSFESSRSATRSPRRPILSS